MANSVASNLPAEPSSPILLDDGIQDYAFDMSDVLVALRDDERRIRVEAMISAEEEGEVSEDERRAFWADFDQSEEQRIRRGEDCVTTQMIVDGMRDAQADGTVEQLLEDAHEVVQLCSGDAKYASCLARMKTAVEELIVSRDIIANSDCPPSRRVREAFWLHLLVGETEVVVIDLRDRCLLDLKVRRMLVEVLRKKRAAGVSMDASNSLSSRHHVAESHNTTTAATSLSTPVQVGSSHSATAPAAHAGMHCNSNLFANRLRVGAARQIQCAMREQPEFQRMVQGRALKIAQDAGREPIPGDTHRVLQHLVKAQMARQYNFLVQQQQLARGKNSRTGAGAQNLAPRSSKSGTLHTLTAPTVASDIGLPGLHPDVAVQLRANAVQQVKRAYQERPEFQQMVQSQAHKVAQDAGRAPNQDDTRRVLWQYIGRVANRQLAQRCGSHGQHAQPLS